MGSFLCTDIRNMLRFTLLVCCVAYATSAAIAIRGYGQPATIGQTIPYGYAASGQYVADSVGAIHYAKRSDEADPYYGYGGYGYYGPVASGISSVSYAGFPLQGYSHGYGFGYGKRSAEADPFYGYGGYGYHGPVTSGLSSVSHAGFPLQGYAQGYGYGW